MTAGRATRALLFATAAAAAARISSAEPSVDIPVSPLSQESVQAGSFPIGKAQRFVPPSGAGGFSLDPVEPRSSFFTSTEFEAMVNVLVDKLPVDEDTYDYIVVGGGAGGCAVADVLSQGGNNVLLLERGMERSLATTPNAMSARGAGGAGYRAWGGGDYPDPSLFVRLGYQWVGYSLFDANNNLQRNAADALLEATPYLTVKTRHTVRVRCSSSIRPALLHSALNTHISSPTALDALRVIYRQTGRLGSGPSWNPRQCSWSPAPRTHKGRSAVFASHTQGEVASSSARGQCTRRCCCTDQLGLIKVPQILDNPAVGSSFSDRVFLTIPGFLKHYVDAIPLVNPSRSLRRLQADESVESHKVTKLRLTREPAFEPILTQEELEKALTPEIREAVHKIMTKSLPMEIITLDEDEDQTIRTRYEPPVLLPDFLLFPGKLQYLAPALQPRVCQFMGLKHMGPNCRGMGINERNLGCTLATMEELSGDRTAEGFIYASRYIFPTMYRKDPIIDAVVELLQACANYRAPFGIVLLKPLCIITQPIVKCFRKAVAPFYFTSEPKSRGSIRLKSNGEVVIDPQYLVNEQDLFDAVRGVSSMIEQLNGDSYKGILQKKGPQSCPLAILNGLLDVLLTLSTATSPFLTNSRNFPGIQQHLQDLIPPASRRLRRLMVINEAYRMKPAIYEDEEGNEYEDYSAFIEHDVDEKKMEELGIKRRLEAVGFDFASYRDHIAGKDASAKDPNLNADAVGRRLEAMMEEAWGKEKMGEPKVAAADSVKAEEVLKAAEADPELKEAIEECKKPCTPKSIEERTCAKFDVCCTAYGNSKCIRLPGQPPFADSQTKEIFSSADGAHDGEAVKTEEFLAPFFGFVPGVAPGGHRPQWAATYPPMLPSVTNPKAVAKFALSYMTSIGHTYGSAPMGKVVDNRFQVMGVNGLSIVDASVLPQLTRMNPVYTIMAFGRYAGEMMMSHP
ncbi:hypothetical protein ACSSS7_003355 [Eimeria intestinalis]